MRQSSIIRTFTIRSSAVSRISIGGIVLVLILMFLLSPKVNVSAQTGTEEIPNQSHYTYFPITLRSDPVHYVSPEGNDNNPGTFTRPWKTVGKAAQAVTAGETVYLRQGIYHERVRFETSGTSLNPINVLAFPGENPIIDGNFSIPESGGYLLELRGNYIQISGIEVRNSAYGGVFIYGNYDVIDQMYVHHTMVPGVIIYQGIRSTVANSRIWRTSLENEFGATGHYSAALAAYGGASYATIRNNEVWENWGGGIVTSGANQIIIEDNISHDNYSTNIKINGSTNILVQHNFVYTNPNSYVFPYSHNVGISMGDESYLDIKSNSITFINNLAFGNYVNFWWWPVEASDGMNNVLIANNTFVNATAEPGSGRGNVLISEGNHIDVRFENNLVLQDNALPVIAINGQLGITFANNLWSKSPYPWVSSTNDVINDPLLAQAGDPYNPAWYMLTSASPAIDAGVYIPEVTVDYFGNAREAPPDMGANEFFP